MLRLALVKRIAELSDAAVTVQSTPGAGSVFAVRFPKADKTAGEEER